MAVQFTVVVEVPVLTQGCLDRVVLSDGTVGSKLVGQIGIASTHYDGRGRPAKGMENKMDQNQL